MIYAVIGLYLFNGKYDKLLSEDLPEGTSWDTLLDATLVIFQILTGSNWDSILWASVRVTDFDNAWYFITFVLIVTILFANVFIGIVLEVLSAVTASKKFNLSSRDIERLIIDHDEDDRDTAITGKSN